MQKTLGNKGGQRQDRRGEPGQIPRTISPPNTKTETLLGNMTCHASAPIMAKVGKQQQRTSHILSFLPYFSYSYICMHIRKNNEHSNNEANNRQQIKL